MGKALHRPIGDDPPGLVAVHHHAGHAGDLLQGGDRACLHPVRCSFAPLPGARRAAPATSLGSRAPLAEARLVLLGQVAAVPLFGRQLAGGAGGCGPERDGDRPRHLGPSARLSSPQQVDVLDAVALHLEPDRGERPGDAKALAGIERPGGAAVAVEPGIGPRAAWSARHSSRAARAPRSGRRCSGCCWSPPSIGGVPPYHQTVSPRAIDLRAPARGYQR